MKTTAIIARTSTVLATLLVPYAVSAAETLYIGGPGGSYQKAIEEKLIPAFEAKTGAKVVYVPGSSSDTLAKLIAQKGKQDLSIIAIDSSVMRQAVNQDLCAALPDSLVVKDLYPAARMEGNKSVGTGFYAVGLGYNKDVFAKNGWAAPTSWKDLGDPKFKGKVSMGPFSGYGVEALVLVAKANGGSERDIDPGFKFMSEKVAPNVFAWEGNQANLAQMFQTGEAALIVWGNTRVIPVADQGAPVAFVIPKEGAEQAMNAACVVNGGPQAKLGGQLLEYFLSPEAQTIMAESSGYGPTNSKVKLKPELAAKVIYGPEQVNSLLPTDWPYVNTQRDAWAKRWNREIEQR